MIDFNKNMMRHRVRRVVVKQSFKQVDKKRKANYFGTIKIGSVLFEYTLTILKSFDWHDTNTMKRVMSLLFGSGKDIEDVRKHYFGISMKRNKKEIRLTSKEYTFFVSMIIPYVYGFFQRQETQALINIKEEALRKGISYHGIKEVTSLSYLTITEEETKLLQSTKFGCKFD